MALKENYNNDPLCFVIIDKMPGSDLQLVAQAATPQIRDNMVAQIRSLLDMQGDFLRGEKAVFPLNLTQSFTVHRTSDTISSSVQHISAKLRCPDNPAIHCPISRFSTSSPNVFFLPVVDVPLPSSP